MSKIFKNIFLLIFTMISFSCVKNKVFIKEVYFGKEKLSAEDKKKLTLKEVKVCNTRSSIFGRIQIPDEYDRKLPEVLDNAFTISKNFEWYDVELYNEEERRSCKILKGYFYEKK